jgi:hypothetical protein
MSPTCRTIYLFKVVIDVESSSSTLVYLDDDIQLLMKPLIQVKYCLCVLLSAVWRVSVWSV